jgi:hypothetical protein
MIVNEDLDEKGELIIMKIFGMIMYFINKQYANLLPQQVLQKKRL